MAEGKEYYNQDTLWGSHPEPYQIQVLADILDLLPHDIARVLDVGCGDGYITNALPTHLHVVGLETSNVALRHLKRDALRGSVTALPFPDNAFDLVMANDVLEHIAPQEYPQVLKELARVASRYLLITVPYNEQLAAHQAKCAACGARYHINWHQRSYDVATLPHLFAPRFRAVEIRFSGDVTRPPFDPLIAFRQRLGFYATWKGAMCPRCGSKEQKEYQEEDLWARILATQRSLYWFDTFQQGTQGSDRTEIIGLYTTTGSSGPQETPGRQERIDSLLSIDFSNPLQVATPDFVPGACWAKFSLPAGAIQTAEGLQRSAEGAELLVIPIRLPVKAEVGDQIRIEISGSGDGAALGLYAIDGIHGQSKQLLMSSLNNTAQPLDLRITTPWWPDRFGLALELHVLGQACVHTLTYEATKRQRHMATFMLLELGHNVLRWQQSGLTYSWGLLVQARGYYPKPALPWHDETADRQNVPTFSETLQWATQAYKTLQQAYHTLNELVEHKEQQRATAESAYKTLQQAYHTLQQRLECRDEQRVEGEPTAWQQMQRQLATLQTLVEQKEQARSAAETAYSMAQQEYRALHQQFSQTVDELHKRLGIRGGTKEILRSVKRRVLGPPMGVPQPAFPAPWQPLPAAPSVEDGCRKVLVLSHMYPHPDQLLSGPFVHEQVKALRQYHKIDARVLVGRPYWMFHRNPIAMLRMEKYYRLFHDSCKWWSLDGVPVKYVPYRVCAPFWTHGWAYRSSFCRGIDQIYREFPFELIHAHTGYLDGSAGLAIAKRYGVPLIITEHTGPFSSLINRPVVRHWTLRSLNGAAKIITVSTRQQQDVAVCLAGHRHECMLVLPNGVDTDVFYPAATWTPDPRAPRLLFVGYFVPVKNVPRMLKAFAIVLHTLPGATLKLVGKGEREQQEVELRNLVSRLGLAHKIEFLGLQSRTDVARIMREEADILVLSSNSESFGCVLIEALACGKPVVSTRSGGPEDIITAEFLGELCANESPETLAAAIIKAASNLNTYAPECIRQYVEYNFSYKSLAKALENLYQKVCEKR